MDTFTERYVAVRPSPVRDLIGLAREAAAMLSDRGSSAQEQAIAAALNGSAAEVASDIRDLQL